MVGLKFFTFFFCWEGESTGFSLLVGWGESFAHQSKTLLILTHQENTPCRILLYNKVIISFRTHYTSAWQPKQLSIHVFWHITKSSSGHTRRQCMRPAAYDDFVICWNAWVDRFSCCQAHIKCVLKLMMTSHTPPSKVYSTKSH